MHKSYTIVANWKMYFSYQEAAAWLNKHAAAVADAARTSQQTVIIAPSFDVLSSAYSIIQKTGIKLSAQDCSAYEKGAYTGEVQANSLKQLGCTYCIIGHSETRSAKNSDEIIAQKLQQVIAAGLHPIIAIGESLQTHKEDSAIKSLEQQLAPLVPLLQTITVPFSIAYEPLWAIGTGIAAPADYVASITDFLQKTLKIHGVKAPFSILYGGSVTPESLHAFKDSATLDGFLIGKASIDAQELLTIIKILGTIQNHKKRVD